jgi:hypothetical protein
MMLCWHREQKEGLIAEAEQAGKEIHEQQQKKHLTLVTIVDENLAGYLHKCLSK